MTTGPRDLTVAGGGGRGARASTGAGRDPERDEPPADRLVRPSRDDVACSFAAEAVR